VLRALRGRKKGKTAANKGALRRKTKRSKKKTTRATLVEKPAFSAQEKIQNAGQQVDRSWALTKKGKKAVDGRKKTGWVSNEIR